jgi:hypothetical protein
MLSSAAEPAPLPPPVGDSEEISSLHVKFARLVQSAQAESSRTERGAAGSERAGGGAGGVRAKVRARVAAVARADAGADREFMGDLVRAIAALAERLDDVTTRMGHLERLVQDVVDRLSEDLVRVQAALGALDLPVPQEPSRRDTEPGRPRDADG